MLQRIVRARNHRQRQARPLLIQHKLQCRIRPATSAARSATHKQKVKGDDSLRRYAGSDLVVQQQAQVEGRISTRKRDSNKDRHGVAPQVRPHGFHQQQRTEQRKRASSQRGRKARIQITATGVGRCRRQCRERCQMVLRLIFSNVKSRKQESETYDCGRNKIPGVLETSASDSGIMRKIQEQESSRARLWWPDSGMMQMIQEQESTLLAGFWNNRQETGSRFLKFT